MLRLFGSELLRTRSRRLIPVLVVACLLGTVVGMTIAAVQSKKPTQQQLDAAERRYQRDLTACLAGGRYSSEYGSLEEACNANIQVGNYLSGGMELAELPAVVQGVAFVVILLGLVIGASLVGAEFSAGTVATLLAWDARRIRVLLTRALATALAALVVAVVVLAFFSSAYALATLARGITEAPRVVGDTVEVIARVAAATVVASLIGMSLATVARSTAGGLGILLGYMVLVEGFLRGLIRGLGTYLFALNTFVFVSDQPQQIADGGGPRAHLDLTTPNEALLVMAIWVVALVAIALAAFRSRDVS
jgi:ABC-2 type transport system permease protein